MHPRDSDFYHENDDDDDRDAWRREEYEERERYRRHGRDDKPRVGTVVSKDGNVLGGLLKLPTPLLIAYQTFEPEVKDWISERLSKHATTYTELALDALHVSKANKIAVMAGQTVAYVLPYIDSIGFLNQARKFHHEQRQAILTEVAPLIAAKRAAEKRGVLDNITGLFKHGYEHNLMIAHALEAVNNATYHKLGSHATDLLPNILLNLRTNAKNQLEKARVSGDQANIKKYTKSLDELLGDKAMRITGAARSGMQQLAKGKDLEDALSHLSYGKVLEIGEYLHKNELDCTKTKPTESNVEEVSQLVEATFKQFQEENKGHGYRPLPTRRLKEVSNQVADKLVNGELNWRSLFDIIGKGELLTRARNGFRGKKEVEHILDREVQLMSKHATIDVEQFFSEASYTLDDVKAHLASKDKDERALVVFLHDDPVLLKAGMKKEEIKHLRDHFSNKVMEKMLGSIVDGLSQLPDDQLQAKGYSDDDIYSLRDYAENHRLIGRALDKKGHSHTKHEEDLKNIIRPVMGEQSDYLQQILSGKNVADETRKPGKEEPDETHDSRAREEDRKESADDDHSAPKHHARNGGSEMRRVSKEELDDMPGFRAREKARGRESDEDEYPPPKTHADRIRRESVRESGRESGDEAYIG